MTVIAPTKKYVSTTNACKLCRPMGAALAFRGIEGTVPFLHGSQGCATYMRRYIISHYNEPIDIASSSLGEKSAIFGGGPNLKKGIVNVTAKYRPRMIGIATTCLTETIGDDVPMILHELRREVANPEALPLLVQVSTPSYSGTHMEGFHGAVRAVIGQLVGQADDLADDLADEQADEQTDDLAAGPIQMVNLLPGFVSPADIRHLKEMVADFGLAATVLPDISETLDGPALLDYPLIPAGGTPLAAIRVMGKAGATIELGSTLDEATSAGALLRAKTSVPLHRLDLPIGIMATDRLLARLATISGQPIPEKYRAERGRLVDGLVDGHKYVSGKRAVVYGEEDLVVGLTAFLAEIGVRPVLCASGGRSGRLAAAIRAATGDILVEQPRVYEGADFFEIAEQAEQLAPDLLVGHGKGYTLARKLNIPLIRVGFPIHDRIGGQRLLHVGFQGAMALFDRIANGLIEKKQADSGVGYSYM